MVRAVVVLVVVAAVLLVLVRFRQQREAAPFRELVKMCRGDEAHAQRLVAGERRKHPALSHRQAAMRAVLSWKRDLR